MLIKVNVNDENIRKAASIVMKHYKDKQFLELILNVTNFKYTYQSPLQVALSIEQAKIEVEVEYYKSFNPWSRATAHTKNNVIYINTRKFASVVERSGTLIHECMHVLGYEHKGNRVTSFNLQTVPYKVQMLFERYVRGIYG